MWIQFNMLGFLFFKELTGELSCIPYFTKTQYYANAIGQQEALNIKKVIWEVHCKTSELAKNIGIHRKSVENPPPLYEI